MFNYTISSPFFDIYKTAHDNSKKTISKKYLSYIKKRKEYSEKIKKLKEKNPDSKEVANLELKQQQLNETFSDMTIYGNDFRKYNITAFPNYIGSLEEKKHLESKDIDKVNTTISYFTDTFFSAEELKDRKDLLKVEYLYRLLAANEKRRFETAQKLIDNGAQLSIKDVMKIDTFNNDLRKTSDEAFQHKAWNMQQNIIKFKKAMDELSSKNHKNSAEFTAMYNAADELQKAIAGKSSRDKTVQLDIGNKLEALREASTNYIAAKGVNNQRTKMGKARIAYAAHLCYMAVVDGETFPSEKRLENIKNTKDMLLNHNIAIEEKAPVKKEPVKEDIKEGIEKK